MPEKGFNLGINGGFAINQCFIPFILIGFAEIPTLSRTRIDFSPGGGETVKKVVLVHSSLFYEKWWF